MTKTSTQSVQEFVSFLNDRYYLPAIQRDFVWNMEQIIMLFDSLARGYPIGTFLIWDINDDQLSEQPCYQFVTDYINDSQYPEDEFQYASHRPSLVETKSTNSDSIRLILDGQQRLTAFNIALEGSITDRISNRKRANPESWNRKKLCINLLSDPDTSGEEFNDQKYSFSFRSKAPIITENNYHYPIKDFPAEDPVSEESPRVVNRLMDETGLHEDEIDRTIIEKNLEAVKNAISREIDYFEERDVSYSEVLEIFTRTNDAGTPLGKDQLLLSRMTARWMDERSPGDPLIARQEVSNFLNNIMDVTRPLPPGFTRPSFVLKALQTCSDVSVKYSVKQYNVLTIDNMKQTWVEGKFQDAIHDTIDLIYSYDFDGSLISNSRLVFPVLYYLFKNRPVSAPDGQLDPSVRMDVHYYLCTATIYEVFNTDSSQKLNRIRKVVDNYNGSDFPLEAISKTLSNTGQSLEPDSDQLQAGFERGNIKPDLVRSLLYRPETAGNPNRLIEYNIFPSNIIRKVVEEGEQVDEDARKALSTVANTVLLPQDVDTSSYDEEKPFEWFRQQADPFKEEYYLPTDQELYEPDEAGDFILKRVEHIIDILTNRDPFN